MCKNSDVNKDTLWDQNSTGVRGSNSKTERFLFFLTDKNTITRYHLERPVGELGVTGAVAGDFLISIIYLLI